jgi:hypothetical protein
MRLLASSLVDPSGPANAARPPSRATAIEALAAQPPPHNREVAAVPPDRTHPPALTLIEEIAAWERERNIHNTKSDWHFTTKDARIKLKHLYPSI